MTAPDWAARVAAARTAATAARAAEEQAVRDAVAAGMTPSAVARALGVANRQRVYAILGRASTGGEPAEPPLTPVVYLRAGGNPDAVLDRVRAAMWARGWAVTQDRTQAWHLARGAAPVVWCDIGAGLDDSGAHYGYRRYVVVGRVRARYADRPARVAVGSLLPTAEAVRLMRAGCAWVDAEVETTERDMELPLVNGGRSPRPHTPGPGATLDVAALARLVAEALGE